MPLRGRFVPSARLGFADYNISFAQGAMVLAYSTASKNGATIAVANAAFNPPAQIPPAANDWYAKLTQPGVVIAGSNPFLEPSGYRADLIFQLTEGRYGVANLYDALVTHYTPTRTGDAIGKNFDYQFTYEHSAFAAYLANPTTYRYVRLPEEVGLSSSSMNEQYEKASIVIPGLHTANSAAVVRIPATRVTWRLTILKQAPNPDDAVKFLQLLDLRAWQSSAAPVPRLSRRKSAVSISTVFRRRCAPWCNRSSEGTDRESGARRRRMSRRRRVGGRRRRAPVYPRRRPATRGCALDLGVELGADQERQAAKIEPKEQRDHRADRAVGQREVVEVAHVQLQDRRCEQPERDADDGSRQQPAPRRALDIRGEAVDDVERRDREDDDDRPACRRPHGDCFIEAGVGETLAEAPAVDHEHERRPQQHQQRQREQRRHALAAQPRGLLAHVVDEIERHDDGAHSLCHRPAEQQQRERQRPAAGRGADFAHDRVDERRGRVRCNHADQAMEHGLRQRGRVQRHPEQGDEQQQQGKEREQEEERQTRRLAADVVLAAVAPAALDQLTRRQSAEAAPAARSLRAGMSAIHRAHGTDLARRANGRPQAEAALPLRQTPGDMPYSVLIARLKRSLRFIAHGLGDAQASADADYFLHICGRQFVAGQVKQFRDSMIAAYRWQYIASGVQDKRFQ